jgi:hypothetical protein
MRRETVWLILQVEIHDSMDEGGQVSQSSTQPQQPPPAFPLLRVATDPAVRSAAEAACLAEGSSPGSPAASAAAAAAAGQHASETSQPGGAALRAALAFVRSAGSNGKPMPQLARTLAAADAAGEHLAPSR